MAVQVDFGTITKISYDYRNNMLSILKYQGSEFLTVEERTSSFVAVISNTQTTYMMFTVTRCIPQDVIADLKSVRNILYTCIYNKHGGHLKFYT